MTQTDAKKYDFIQKNYLDNSRLPWEREGAGYRPTNNSKMEIAPDGKFGEDSTYASHYPPKIGQRNDAIKPQGQIQIGGKFEGNSNYSQQYGNKGRQVATQPVVHADNKILPEGPFAEKSTYNGAYVPNYSQRSPQIKPEGQLKVGGGEFSSDTSYSYDYLPKEHLRSQAYQQPQNQIMPKGKFQGNSTYGNSYIHSPGKREKQIRPQQQIQVGGRFEGNSSYTADYPFNNAQTRVEKIIHPSNQILPEGKFQQATTYHGAYVPNSATKTEKIVPVGQLKVNGGHFESNSSYTFDYMQKGNFEKNERVPLPKNQIMPVGKFDGDTTYDRNYVYNQAKRETAIRPEQQLKVGGKFEGNSSYANDYLNKGLQQKIVLQKYPTNDVIPKGKFQGNSTYNNVYTNSTNSRREPIIPQQQIKVGGKFQGNSSYAGDYVNNGYQQRPEQHIYPPNKVIPNGKFQGNTTYEKDYIHSPVKRQNPIHPHSSLRLEGKFQGNSSYVKDYENRGESGRQEKIVHNDNGVIPLGKFSGNTTYQHNYVQPESSKNPIIRPKAQLKTSQAPFQGVSTYNDNYRKGQHYRSDEYRRLHSPQI